MKNIRKYANQFKLAICVLLASMGCVMAKAQTINEDGKNPLLAVTGVNFSAEEVASVPENAGVEGFKIGDTPYLFSIKKRDRGGSAGSYNFDWKDSFGLGIKLKGGKTYLFTATFFRDTSKYGVNALVLKSGEAFASATIVDGGTFAGNGSTTTVTLTITPTEDTTYWVTGYDSNTVRLYAFSFFESLGITGISGNHSWYAGSSAATVYEGFTSDDKYFYFSGDLNLDTGTTVQVHGANDNGTYDLTGGVYFGFRRANTNRSCFSLFVPASAPAPTVLAGEHYSIATPITVTPKVATSGDTKIYMYEYPYGEPPTTYWVTGTKLGAMELGLDCSNVDKASGITALAQGDSWTPPTGDAQVSINTPTSADKFYFVGYATFKSQFTGGELRMLTGSAMGFKLPANKKVTLTVSTLGDIGTSVKLTKGTPNGTIVSQVGGANATYNSGGGIDTQTFTIITGTTDEVYYIKRADTDDTKLVYLKGITATTIEDFITDFGLTSIENDFIWHFRNGGTGASGKMSDYVYHHGANAVGNGEGFEIDVNGYMTQGYNLWSAAAGDIGFQIKAGTKGVIYLYSYHNAEVILKTGDHYENNTVIDPAPVRTVNGNTDIRAYAFDLTESTTDVMYWVSVNGALASLEVLFDNSNPRAAESCTTIPVEAGAATPTTTSWWVDSDKDGSQIVNGNTAGYIADASTFVNEFDIYKSGKASTYNYMYGPSMIVNLNTVNGHNPVWLNNLNAVGMRLPAKRNIDITIYATGVAGSKIKVMKGVSPSTAELVGEITIADGVTAYPISQFVSGDAVETYWIMGNEGEYALFAGYDVQVARIHLAGPLLNISSYHIWYAGENETELAPNSYQDANYLRYNQKVAGDPLYLTSRTCLVNDIETPTYRCVPNDEFVIRLAANTKGTVRIYYVADEVANSAVPDKQISLDGLSSDWGALYDPATHAITCQLREGQDNAWQGRGWYFGTQDYSDYSEVEITINNPDNLPINFGVKYIKEFVGTSGREYGYADVTSNPSQTTAGEQRLVVKLPELYKGSINQVYVRTAGAEGTFYVQNLVFRSKVDGALTINDIDIKTGGDQTLHWQNTSGISSIRSSETSIFRDCGSLVKEVPFTIGANDQYRRIEIHSDDVPVNIAAIEVLFDDVIVANPNKNVFWYVNKDTKMIAGSEKLTTQDGVVIGEEATFYVSKGRKATVAFYMPAITDLIHNKKNPNGHYRVSIKNGGTTTSLTFPYIYDENGQLMNLGRTDENPRKSDAQTLYSWQTQTWTVNPGSDNTQTVTITAVDLADPDNDDTTERTWIVKLKFIYLDAPTISASGNNTSSTSATITMTPANGYPMSEYPIYYTSDSTDPANLGNQYISKDERFSCNTYTTPITTTRNSLYYAAQYLPTPLPFYEDGPGSQTSRVMKVISNHFLVNLKDLPNMIYVPNPSVSGNTVFAHTAGDIDILRADTGGQRVLRLMYGSGASTGLAKDAVRFFRMLSGDNNFQYGAVRWDGTTYAQDGGYDTYMDPYESTMMGCDGDKLASPKKTPNSNPNTELNGGLGGRGTENGGMFLQPISGAFFRLEPEFDGIVTIWIRQNGMSEGSTMYNGKLTRRPVYVLDEDGVIQRGSTIRPTALHHLSVNGVYAEGSGRNQVRSDFAQSWRYGTRSQTGWHLVYGDITTANENWYPDNFRVLQLWFGDVFKLDANVGDAIPGLTLHNGFNGDHTQFVSTINLNPFERYGTRPMYRDDWLYSREMSSSFIDTHALDQFAKYGYEIPNFAYVRYYIPVKAGKTYYIGGRGTKTGFVACEFEALECNYVNTDWQRADNPNIIDHNGNTPVQAYLDWNVNVPPDGQERTYSAAEALLTYGTTLTGAAATGTDLAKSTIAKYVINENGIDANSALTTTMIDGDYWWNKLQVNNNGNMLVGTTINVDLVREFEVGKWHPIVLPFSVSESRLKEIFGDDVKVLYLDPVDHSFSDDSESVFKSVYRPAVKDNSLNFTYHFYQMLYANTPAFICPSALTTNSKLLSRIDGKMVVHFLRVTFVGGTVKSYDIGGGYRVTGAYQPTNNNTEMYYISNEQIPTSTGSKNHAVVYHTAKGIPMKGMRAWIVSSDPHAAPPRLVSVGYSTFFDEEFEPDSGNAAAIYDIVADDEVIETYNDGGVYDLLGRRVAEDSLEGLPKGVYIHKGKKVYVR